MECPYPIDLRIWLLFLLCISHYLEANGQSVHAGNESLLHEWWSPPVTACVSDDPPMVACDGFKVPEGYQVDLFNKVVQSFGYFPRKDVRYVCMEWDDMIADLGAPDGICDVAPSTVEMNQTYIDLGIQFTFPNYKSGLLILLRGSQRPPGLWKPFTAFHWTVWLALALTAPVVAIAIWAADKFHAKAMIKEEEYHEPSSFSNLAWNVLGKMAADIGDTLPVSWGARIILTAFGFLLIIITNIYTAQMSALVMDKRLATDVRDIKDLVHWPKERVATWYPYVQVLQELGVHSTGYKWDTSADLQLLLDMLLSNVIDVIILDAPTVKYVVGNHCGKLVYAGDPFHSFELSFAFPPQTDPEIVNLFSYKMVKLQRKFGIMDLLEDRNLMASVCPSNGEHDQYAYQITIYQVAALYVILAIFVGFSAFLVVLHRVNQNRAWAVQTLRSSGSRLITSMTMRRGKVQPMPTIKVMPEDARIPSRWGGPPLPGTPGGLHPGGAQFMDGPEGPPDTDTDERAEGIIRIALALKKLNADQEAIRSISSPSTRNLGVNSPSARNLGLHSPSAKAFSPSSPSAKALTPHSPSVRALASPSARTLALGSPLGPKEGKAVHFNETVQVETIVATRTSVDDGAQGGEAEDVPLLTAVPAEGAEEGSEATRVCLNRDAEAEGLSSVDSHCAVVSMKNSP